MKNQTRQLFAALLLAALSHTAQAQTGDCRFKDAEALKSYLKPGKRTTPLIMAHQGGTEDGFPGNSMATFERTYSKVPCVLLEIDVRATADSLLVISHDDDLALKNQWQGVVEQKKVERNQQTEVKRSLWFHDGTPHTHIPGSTELVGWQKSRANRRQKA